MITDVTHSHRT